MASITNNQPLALQAINNSRAMVAYPLLMLAGIVLITVSAKIQVPFWPVPMTLQTMAIALVAAVYGLRLGVSTIVGYLALGAMGVPVFAGPVAGLAYMVGPTAGFLAGFVVLTAIVGFAVERMGKLGFWKTLGAMLVGDLMLFTLGFVWLGYFFVTGSGATLGGAIAWEKGVQPYILADLFKMTLAAASVIAIGSLVRR